VGFPLTVVNGVIEELRAAKVPFQYEVYSGANHGFSTPKGRDNERANEQSIASATRHLREVFGD
jgi:dienelactone hydrolase